MSAASKPYTTLNLEQVDRIGQISYKARGILACIRIGSEEAGNLPDDALAGACWAVEDMIKEVRIIACGPEPEVVAQ